MPPADYREIAAALRSEIAAGQYPPGGAFPTGPDIAARWNVSQGTANLAMGELRREGLIRTKRGRGTIVNPVPVLPRDAAGRQRREAREAGGARGAFDAEVRRAGHESRTETQVGHAAPPPRVAAILSIPDVAGAVYRRRRMYVDGEPVQLATSWIPADIAQAAPAVGEPDTGPGGLYSRLADAGHAPAWFTEDVTVRVPADGEADLLGLDPDHRVYDIIRTATDSRGRAVEVNQIVMPTHQWTLSYTWPAED